MNTDLTKKFTFMLCGDAQSGKTSLSEGILFKSSTISNLGKVNETNTVSDYEEDEKERKSSINLSVVRAQYGEYKLQFIDTPGHLDSIGEVVTASHAVDFALLVIDAVEGVGPGAQKAWEITQKQNIPCLFVINKLDDPQADLDKVIRQIHDIFTKKLVLFGDWQNGKAHNVLKDKGSALYGKIVEAAAETNDALLEEYLSTGALKDDELITAIKTSIDNDILFPVVAVSSMQDESWGVLIDTIVDIMPSAGETLPRKISKEGEELSLSPSLEGPFIAQVFKTVVDPFMGRLTIFRVYSGRVKSGDTIYNADQSCKEKFGHIIFLQGKEHSEQDGACAGDIAAVTKLKETQTLDVLTDTQVQYSFPALDLPTPSYAAAVKPKTRNDEEKLSDCLHKLSGEDLGLRFSRDAQTNELVISGMGELHLQILVNRMRNRYHVEVELGTPQVPYRETISRAVKVQGKHKKQSGGHGQYGDCWLEVEPLAHGSGFEFLNKVVGGAIPKNFIPSIEKGVKKAMEHGVLAGYPVVDVRVTVYDGSYHDVDSSDMAFQLAGSLAMKKALEEAGSILLEPIVNAEISAAAELMGNLTGDITSRRGKIMGMDVRGNNEVIKAQVPLAEMFHYASDLRSVTAGRGSYTMSFDHYECVPVRLTQEIVNKAKEAAQAAQAGH